MLKKVVCFVSIVFAIALVAKSVIFILSIMGGAKLDADCISQLVELGLSWLGVLVGAVAFVFKLFEAPKTIRVPVPVPLPFPVHDDDDEKPEDDDPEKPEDEKPEGTEDKPEDEKPEGGTEEKPKDEKPE